MAKLGEIPHGEPIDRDHPDFSVVESPDGVPHYVPRDGIIVEEFPGAPFRLNAETGTVIAESAQLDESVVIGARSLIGPETQIKADSNIGNDTKIGQKVLIEDKVIVSRRTQVEDGVRIRRKAIIGVANILGRKTTIGSRVETGTAVVTDENSYVYARNSVPTGTIVSGKFGKIHQRRQG